MIVPFPTSVATSLFHVRSRTELLDSRGRWLVVVQLLLGEATLSQIVALCDVTYMENLQKKADSARRNGTHVKMMTNEYSATVGSLGTRVRWLIQLCYSQIQLVLNAFSVGCAGFSVLSPYRALFLGLTATSLGMSHMRHRQGPHSHKHAH